MNVLLVEDDLDVRNIVSTELASRELMVTEAGTLAAGRSALDQTVDPHLGRLPPGRIRARPDLGGPAAQPARARDRPERSPVGGGPLARAGTRRRRLRNQAILRQRARHSHRGSHPAARPCSGSDRVRSADARPHRPSTQRRLSVDGADVSITTKEFDLLAFLAARPNCAFTREQLLRAVWHSRADWQLPATVTEHVRRLRAKVELHPARPAILVTVRGVGYRFEYQRDVGTIVPSTTEERAVVVYRVDGTVTDADDAAARMLGLGFSDVPDTMADMRSPEKPADESARLAELRSLGLLDSESEERFDRVTRLAQRLFNVPIALVSLVDEDRQWFKSRQGLEATETSRDVSFCGHAILGDEVMHVPDARADVRFADNPLVTEDPSIRFYAGCPISGPGGSKLGTLCIIGREPRTLSESDTLSLRDLAEMVEREIAALHLATSDDLTGLMNRRGFDLLVTKVVEVCRRRGVGAVLLYMDLAGFKAINDEFGHAEGDRALQEFARILEHTFRTSDVIARLGGDEFAVLLSATTDPDDACGRLRAALADRNRAAPGFALKASIGAASFDPAGEDTLADLVARADAAMYADKRSSL